MIGGILGVEFGSESRGTGKIWDFFGVLGAGWLYWVFPAGFLGL